MHTWNEFLQSDSLSLYGWCIYKTKVISFSITYWIGSPCWKSEESSNMIPHSIHSIHSFTYCHNIPFHLFEFLDLTHMDHLFIPKHMNFTKGIDFFFMIPSNTIHSVTFKRSPLLLGDEFSTNTYMYNSNHSLCLIHICFR
jgi:hypothetical protein